MKLYFAHAVKQTELFTCNGGDHEKKNLIVII